MSKKYIYLFTERTPKIRDLQGRMRATHADMPTN